MSEERDGAKKHGEASGERCGTELDEVANKEGEPRLMFALMLNFEDRADGEKQLA